MVPAKNLSDPILRHMRTDFPRLFIAQTVEEALDWLRTYPPSGPIIYFYVVDSNDRLYGIVPARRLLLESYDRPLAEISIRTVISLPIDSTVLDACKKLVDHKLLALPVVNDGGIMVGMVDMSIYTEQLPEVGLGRNDDLFQRIGVHVREAKPASAFAGFRLRFPWLGCNLGAGIIAAFLSGVYQNELSRVVELAFFIPVVLNLAESVSSQSVSLALELLRGNIPTWKSMLEKLGHESGTGLLLGTASGIVVGLIALAWLGQPKVSLCLIGGIAGGVTGAAVLGLAMPYVLRIVRLDPQVAAGPIALAGADIITLLIYLNLAHWLLR